MNPIKSIYKTYRKSYLSFQSFSGLGVNYAKSGLILLGKDDKWAAQATAGLGCTLVKLPITYLGVPLGANMNRISSWRIVLN